MLEYIRKFFTEGNWYNVTARIALILAAAVIFYIGFQYARKKNLILLVYIEVTYLVLLFVLSFFDIPNLAFFVYFVLCSIAIATMVFFAQDFRRDLFRRAWRKYVSEEQIHDELGRDDLHKAVSDIVRACQRMSKSDTGALILIADSISDGILDSGTRLNAAVSSDLLETIFFPKTPLHDGAVVITANKVVAAGCYLPLTQKLDLPREFGTRHRAALGISEANPALTALVVSEETGIISAMHDGKVKRYLDAESLARILERAFRLSDSEEEERIWGIIEDEE